MKYGVKVFANGKEVVNKVYTNVEIAKSVANGYSERGYRVYRAILNTTARTAKMVDEF